MTPESFPLAALNCFGEFSPIAKSIASAILDLPLPLGPVMTVKPGSILTATGLAPDDLKPLISNRRINVIDQVFSDFIPLCFERI